MDKGILIPAPEPETPKIPMDYTWAKRLGLVRKPANFVSSISDDRGEELKYAGIKISEVFEEDMGVGGVLSLLWFRRQVRLCVYFEAFSHCFVILTRHFVVFVAAAQVRHQVHRNDINGHGRPWPGS